MIDPKREQMVGPTYCPFCASVAEPRRIDVGALPLFGDAQQERAYSCPTCGRTWSVDGRQESLDLSA